MAGGAGAPLIPDSGPTAVDALSIESRARQVAAIGDSTTRAAVARVTAAEPASDAYGLNVRIVADPDRPFGRWATDTGQASEDPVQIFVAPLTGRRRVVVRNLSETHDLYVGESAAAVGVVIGPGAPPFEARLSDAAQVWVWFGAGAVDQPWRGEEYA